MIDFSDFRESGRINDIAIQHTLRQLDSEMLSMALVEMAEEDREIFYRNMSKRACDLLMEDVAEREKHPAGTFTEASRRAQERIRALFDTHRAMVREDEERTPDEPPQISCTGDAELIETLVQLRRFVGRHGVLALEGVDLEGAPPLLSRGLELYVHGYDGALVQSVLEQMKESLVTRFTNTQNLILEGVGALMGSTPAHEMREKLEAFRLDT